MGEFVNFASGTITDSPLTIGATAVNSAAFATVLPVIAAPHTMSIVVDPGAVDGIPEIMSVTAHTAAATTATVIRGQQTATGGSPARSHVAGTEWALAVTATDANRMTGDPGDLKAGIWSSPPDGWLLMGQSVTTADVTYPALWAVVPASWKSGTTLNLPSMDGRAMLGGGTLGATGGAATHTLLEANLPAHTHAIDHNHAAVTSAAGGVAHTHVMPHTHEHVHTHTINHNHPSATTSSAGSHNHDISLIADATVGGGSIRIQNYAAAGTHATTDTVAAHTHTLDLPTTTGLVSGAASDATTGASSAASTGAASVTDHTHSVDLPVYTGASGSVGSGTAVDHTPSHLRINVAIKW